MKSVKALGSVKKQVYHTLIRVINTKKMLAKSYLICYHIFKAILKVCKH